MNIDKVPLLGRINKTVNVVMVNVILLAVICIILGIVILVFPVVLNFLVSALLIVSALILINISYNIHSFKKKYMKWFE